MWPGFIGKRSVARGTSHSHEAATWAAEGGGAERNLDAAKSKGTESIPSSPNPNSFGSTVQTKPCCCRQLLVRQFTGHQNGLSIIFSCSSLAVSLTRTQLLSPLVTNLVFRSLSKLASVSHVIITFVNRSKVRSPSKQCDC